MSIKDKMKNAKESHLFEEFSEKEKFEAILEGKLKVRLISKLEKIKAEVEDMGWDIHKTERKVPKEYVKKERIYEILDKEIAELKGE